MLEELKDAVCRANLRLRDEGLVVLTWGNASARDARTGLVVIKPSGVSYSAMKASDMVVVDLDGRVVEGKFRPSSDTPTHVELYRRFEAIGGIVHTHSAEATSWAQARREICCYGTTHADSFHGNVPLTRVLAEAEVQGDYERATGVAIAETVDPLAPLARPGALVAGHGPFTWGADVMTAVDNALSLEAIAKMARITESICGSRSVGRLEDYVLEKHYQRKHGPKAYYGKN